jgi:hypothetical protein
MPVLQIYDFSRVPPSLGQGELLFPAIHVPRALAKTNGKLIRHSFTYKSRQYVIQSDNASMENPKAMEPTVGVWPRQK